MTEPEGLLNADEAAMLLSASRRALLIYQIDIRELLICEVILQWSFARSRGEALIPELAIFTRLTGIDDTDVRKILNRLEDRQIVQVKELGRDTFGRKLRSYRFRPFAAWWTDAPSRVNVEIALTAAELLDQVNALGRDTEPSGQVRLFTSVDSDLDDGLTAASRDELLKAAASGQPDDAHEAAALAPSRDAHPQPKQVPAVRVTDGQMPPRTAGTQVGVLPTKGPVGKLPTDSDGGRNAQRATDARAPACDVSIRSENETSVTSRNVSGAAMTGTRRFADADRNAAFEKIEALCASGRGWNRGFWVGVVKHTPPFLVAEAVGDTTDYLRRHRPEKAPGAVLWGRLKELARDRGIVLKKPGG